jgi:hypothetical protein
VPTKFNGKLIAKYEGFNFYVVRHTPKRKGKDRIWFGIRQDNPKEWRIAASLSYVKSLDVRFEK